uniref:Uncharacterized protein n=1 Tax=Rhipicephalus appendiculatus TaxID=34631 RepID=A0A131YE21_RHIAP
MARIQTLFCSLLLIILLLGNSCFPATLHGPALDSRKRQSKQHAAVLSQGNSPCSRRCGKGAQFSCMANCTRCTSCSHCNDCNCKCVTKRDPCSLQRMNQCDSMLTLKCRRYKKGCYCYCGIAPLMLMGKF